ncbi:MAG: hypothetical protein IKW11_05170 [Bacteroidales bacterium]|nr:hypothetical protein [Bacteroidales bacterium]
MKRRVLMVSAMILLLGSQVDLSAKGRNDFDRRRPGMEMQMNKMCKCCKDSKAFKQGDVARFQDFFWKKHRVKLSKKDAERILFSHRFDYKSSKGPLKR